MVTVDVPWKLLGGIFFVLLFFTWGEVRGCQGKRSVQKDWDAAKTTASATKSAIVAESAKVTERVETVYVDRIVTVREKANAIIKEVPIYVPSGGCELSGGFRLLHDAAATNSIPQTSRIPYATTVPAQTLARTVTENYGTCHEVRVTLVALQEWVREQRQVYLDQCKLQPTLCNEGNDLQ